MATRPLFTGPWQSYTRSCCGRRGCMGIRDCSCFGGAGRGVGVVALLAACAIVGLVRADRAPAACQKQLRHGPLTLTAGCWQAEPGAFSANGRVIVNGIELRGPGRVRV